MRTLNPIPNVVILLEPSQYQKCVDWINGDRKITRKRPKKSEIEIHKGDEYQVAILPYTPTHEWEGTIQIFTDVNDSPEVFNFLIQQAIDYFWWER